MLAVLGESAEFKYRNCMRSCTAGITECMEIVCGEFITKASEKPENDEYLSDDMKKRELDQLKQLIGVEY